MNTEEGSVLVESAIVLPVIVILLFGMIQYGLIFSAYITVKNASAVAARSAVVTSGSASSISAAATAAIQPYLTPANLSAPAVVYTALTSDYKVTLSYSLPVFFPLVVPGVVGGNYTVRAATTMR